MNGPLVVGVSHHTAPVEVRERMALGESDARSALREIVAAGAAEAIVLSTCNRTEFYFAGASEGAEARAERILAERSGMTVEQTVCYVYRHHDRSAAEHLFRVASSLDSMIVGEAQIQGQVKAALREARDLATPRVVGPVLARLFEQAAKAGARVRSETSLGNGAASVASAAVQLARKIFGTLAGKRALVVGAGEMSKLALASFAAEGLQDIAVANRSAGRAEELARRVGGRAIPYEAMWSDLEHLDIVVTATGAPHRILGPEELEAALPGGPRRPLFLLDIALPRDVDVAVADMDNVFLYDIDDLQLIVGDNLERRRAAIPGAERIIGEEVDRFWDWYAALDVVPVLRGIRTRGEELREAELRRALSKLAHLEPADVAEVERLTRQLLAKLIHDPTVRLKEAASNGRGPTVIEAARYLFAVDEDGEGKGKG
ncbi:MAG: glutamyl-tRNA reductase [Gemmatimonadota bacterium]